MLNKNDIFNKTRIRIIMISNLIVFLCLFVFIFIFQAIFSSNIYKEIDEAILNRAYYIQTDLAKVDAINNSFLNIDVEDVLRNQRIDSSLIITIYKDDIPTLATTNIYFDIYNIVETQIEKMNEIVDLEINDYSFRGIRFKHNQYDIEIITNTDYQLLAVANMQNSMYIALIILLIVSAILSKILADKVIKPIKSTYDKQVFFVQDASHEMRTPLTVIKGKLEILSRNTNYDEENFEHISKIMSEIRSLEKLNTDLLLLSKEDIGFEIITETISINKFIHEISDFYIDLADMQEKNFKIINLNADINVVWDLEKMKRSIIILLENAFKYTNEGDSIKLEVINNNKNIVIKVVDTGMGIKDENKNRVFDRFFRSDDVRATNIQGSGIGLSLLKTIGTILNFKIALKSQYEKGSEFTLIIPKNM